MIPITWKELGALYCRHKVHCSGVFATMIFVAFSSAVETTSMQPWHRGHFPIPKGDREHNTEMQSMQNLTEDSSRSQQGMMAWMMALGFWMGGPRLDAAGEDVVSSSFSLSRFLELLF